MLEANPHQAVPVPRTGGESLRDFELRLLGAFQLLYGAIPIVLVSSAQRLIAFLALQGHPMTRASVAATLWPDVTEARANAALRSVIWRLDELTREAMQIDVLDIALRDIRVDIQDASALAYRLVIVDTVPSETDMTASAIEALSSELLPDWYDDWVLIEAEDWRQVRIHALASLADKLVAVRRFGDAIAAARAAIKADPVRESGHAALISVHLAEGNQSEALAAFHSYEALLQQELKLVPTEQLRALIRDLHP